MRGLILFSAWIDDKGDDYQKWSSLYTEILGADLRNFDKVISLNAGCSPEFAKAMNLIPNVLGVSDCPAYLEIKGDAGGHLHCIARARGILKDYDCVLFLHCKGASQSYSDFIPLINAFREGLLSDILSWRELAGADCLLAREFSLATSQETISQVERLAALTGKSRPIAVQIPSTIYAVSGAVLSAACASLPEEIFEQSLIESHFNRYFFEAVFPSLLFSAGAIPRSTVHPAFQDGFSPFVCYSVSPSHNNAVSLAEVDRWKRIGPDYVQHPTPFVFASLPSLADVIIAYGPH